MLAHLPRRRGDIIGGVAGEPLRCPARLPRGREDDDRRVGAPGVLVAGGFSFPAGALPAKVAVRDDVVRRHVPEEERVAPEDGMVRRRHRDGVGHRRRREDGPLDAGGVRVLVVDECQHRDLDE